MSNPNPVGGENNGYRQNMVRTGQLVCKMCGEVKALSGFYKAGKYRNGETRYNTRCSECIKSVTNRTSRRYTTKNKKGDHDVTDTIRNIMTVESDGDGVLSIRNKIESLRVSIEILEHAEQILLTHYS